MMILFFIFILPQILLINLLFGRNVRMHMHKRNDDYWNSDVNYQTQPDYNAAYECLGISPQSSDDEVKAAYRKLAMKYHPDRYATQGAEAQSSAQKQFLKIQNAYEEIKKIRKKL